MIIYLLECNDFVTARYVDKGSCENALECAQAQDAEWNAMVEAIPRIERKPWHIFRNNWWSMSEVESVA